MPRRPDLYSRWLTEVRKNRYFHAGERVGVAVSGGPDSILLFNFMHQSAGALGLTIAAVHFNHHLRGAESDADEQFVRERAHEFGVAWLRGEADVARAARESRRNLEATARDLRYRFFNSLVSQGKLDKVVTAHTANDQAETVLLRLMRGTGARGLGGIYPVLDGKIFRPFLGVTRNEVEMEIEKRKLEFRVDSSNLNPKLRRNKVRRELLPLLQKEYNPEIIKLLKELSDRSRDDEEALELLAYERGHPWRVREGREERIPSRALTEFPVAVGRRVLRQMILSARGHLKGITFQHIEALRRFALDAQGSRKLVMPGGWEARKEFDWFIFGPAPAGRIHEDYSFPVNVPGEIAVPQLGLNFRFEIIEPARPPKAYNDSERVGLDPRKISGPLVLRNWRAGDKFWNSGGRRPRNVKTYFSRHKVPPGQRKSWPVLACGNEIIWIKDFPPANGLGASTGESQVLIRVDKTSSERLGCGSK
ncbi:MAG TPA: tRNA lysidine(34) synthetase TilS [Terriglobia bacterium]|nr:tRNA lysidine(34) synthetase TilS [Terriglobia bacterium]